MEYYNKNWGDEVEKLYESLQFADIDIAACNEMELQDFVKKYAHFVRNNKREEVPA